MKKLIFIALFAFATITSFATVRTVSNSPFGGSEYSTLLAAYNAATNGDTLLVEGTNVTYSLGQNGGWNKSLTVIGIGFNADKQNPGKTFIAVAHSGSQTGQFSLFAGGSGSSFHGINFTNYLSFVNGASNVLFANCTFASYAFLQQNVSGITFRNSIFTAPNTLNIVFAPTFVMSGVSVSNCVFNGYIEGQNNVNVSMNVDHCIFLGTANPMYNVRNATFSNNIFMNAFLNSTNSGCNFLNNISRLAGTFPPAGLGNIASNNIEATDPNLVTYTLGAAYSTAHDYNLQTGSAAIGAGSDATDIGVHGGVSMFFSESGEVLINPIIREVSIQNPTVSPSGTINVKVIATKPKDN